MRAAGLSKPLLAALATTCAGALLVSPAPAAAPPSAKEAIAARQAGFKKMGAAIKVIKAELGKGTPSKKTLADNAQIVATTLGKQGALFPAGSGPDSGVSTDALAGVWSDRATFDALLGKSLAEAKTLQAAIDSGSVSASRDQFKATGQSCAACHRKFRAD